MFECRVPITIAAGQVAVIDVCPYNQYVATIYTTPAGVTVTSQNTVADNGPITSSSFVSGQLTLTPVYLPLLSQAMATCTPTNLLGNLEQQQTPSMRCTGLCTEFTNLTSLAQVGGALRCLRIESPPNYPSYTVFPLGYGNWTQTLVDFYAACNTQHSALMHAVDGVCAESLPLDFLSGAYSQPSAIDGAGSVNSNAFNAWIKAIYADPDLPGASNASTNHWTVNRYVIDSVNSTTATTCEMVIRGRFELRVTAASFLAGSATLVPLGNIMPVLAESRRKLVLPPFMSQSSGMSRNVQPYIGAMMGKPQEKARQQKPVQKKKQQPRNSTTTTTPRPPQHRTRGRMGGYNVPYQNIGNALLQALVPRAGQAALGNVQAAIRNGELRRRRR